MVRSGATSARAPIEREYLIFFEHDPHVAAGYIRQDGKRLFVEPEPGTRNPEPRS